MKEKNQFELSNHHVTNSHENEGYESNSEQVFEELDITTSSDSFVKSLKENYDNEIEKLNDEIADTLSEGSLFDYGAYQVLSFFVISLAWTLGIGWYAYVGVFTGYSPDHECDTRAMQGMQTNTSESDLFLVPDVKDLQCSALNALTNETLECTVWKYDENRQMKTSMVTEYNLVCKRNYYFETALSIESTGYVFGTPLFSYLGDRFGRKHVLFGCLAAISVIGLVQSFITNFYAFFCLGFFINMISGGVDSMSIPLVIEMSSTTKRTIFGIGIEVIWVVVMTTLSPIAYFVKQWRPLRIIILASIGVLAVFTLLLTQESIYWLISVKKFKRLHVVMRRIARFNRLENKSHTYEQNMLLIENKLKHLDEFTRTVSKNTTTESTSRDLANTNTPKEDRIIDMFKTPKFLLYVLVMSFSWLATALVYDGLFYLNNSIGENIFVNWVLLNLIELPAQIVCYFLVSRLGRRLTICIALIFSGTILLFTCLDLISAFHTNSNAQWIKLTLFVIAKFSITQSYSAVILQAPEIFPTNLRSFGYGICLFASRITSSFAPFIGIYLEKVFPVLPAIIFGSLSILAGCVSLLVPETLNRPLPNRISDVLKWPKTLSHTEWSDVKKINREQIQYFQCVLQNIFKRSTT